MTQRITVSLPDDVAGRLGQEANASAYVTAAVRREMARENTEQSLLSQGFAITPEGRAAARGRLDAARERTTPEVRAQLRERFGRTRPTA
jgi:predicted transcriptional regulator